MPPGNLLAGELADPGADPDRAGVVPDRFGGIEDQVHEHLLELARIRFDCWKCWVQLELDGYFPRDGSAQEPAEVTSHRGKVHRLDVEPTPSRVSQQLPGERGCALTGHHHIMHQFPRWAQLREDPQRETRVPQYAGEQVVEIVS